MQQEVYLLMCSVLYMLLLRVSFCDVMLHYWVGIPQCYETRYFLGLQGSSGPWGRNLYTIPLLHLTCSHFHWATDSSILACISVPHIGILLQPLNSWRWTHWCSITSRRLESFSVTCYFYWPPVFWFVKFWVYKCEVIVYHCNLICALCFWDYKHFPFVFLSLSFPLSYIYDVHLSALNGHHNITIELLHEFHVNINKIDIKMLVLMSLNLLLCTENLLYDMKDSLSNQIWFLWQKTWVCDWILYTYYLYISVSVLN